MCTPLSLTCSIPFRVCSSRRSISVRCQSTKMDGVGVNRRGVGILTGMLWLSQVSDAFALLPDDDDLDLVEKAKAQRKARLQRELESEKQFVRSEGLRKSEDAQLIKSVQKAVFKLAESGSKIESGDLSQVSLLLKDSWVSEFETASKDLSIGVDGGIDGVKSILSGINSLQAAAAKGDASKSQMDYINVVANVYDWTSRAGIQSRLKGL